jgi:cephalosporin hydroxylase
MGASFRNREKNMKTLDDYYLEVCNNPSDIYEHMPILSSLSEQCSSVVEIGVRSMVSSWAFLHGLSKSTGTFREITCVDIVHPNSYGADVRYADFSEECSRLGIVFEFKKDSSLTMLPISCDLLFIDTVHNYEFLSVELSRHGPFAKKFIAMHDTEICKTIGHDHGGGMWKAVEEFLSEYPFEIFQHFTNNNGLTILRRKS